MSVRTSAAPLVAHLRLLGTFGLMDGGGEVVSLVSPRVQSLLAYLALHRDLPQSRRNISFLLWPDSSEAQARNSLRQLVHQLRHSWPDADRFLFADASTLALRPGIDLKVDVDEYATALAAALAADQGPAGRGPEAAAEAEAGTAGTADAAGLRAALERAADLYRGDLLPGSYDEWVTPLRERLISGHQRMLDRLIGLLEQRGDYRAAIEYGRRRSRLDPLDERVYRWLMRLHALDQDRAGALQVYQTCVAVLERELDVEPEPATRHAYEQIQRLEPGSADAVVPSAGIDPGPPTAGLPPDVAPLIGRDREWALAMTAWERMTGGEAHLLLISGEAGIGKSRLAEELCQWAGLRGIKSARTRAYAAEGRLPYAPVTDWLRSPALAAALPRLAVGMLSEIARLLPELLSQRPDLPRPSARIEDWQRQAFFHALASAFLVSDQPLLLVLDDLQWCDQDTLEWLHFLLRSDRGAKVLIAGTVRPDEVDRRHPLASLTAELTDAGRLTGIALGPLGPSETSALAAQVAGRLLTPDQARAIHLETEGNPLFVVETVRAGLVAEAGEHDDAGDAGERSGGTSTYGTKRHQSAPPRRLPPRVQAVIAGRLARLSEPARDLASVAATVGRAFTLEVVRDSSGLADDVLVHGLDELVRRQLVRELGSSAYDFSHDKIREVAYAEMTEARRRLLHRRVAEALERVHQATLDVVAAQIAAHYTNADLADQAAAYYRRAAEVAQRVGANQEAIRLLQRGLALLGSRPPSLDRDARELDLQTALGVSLVATEGYGAADVTLVYARCRQLCQMLGRSPSPPILRALALVSLAQARFDECHALGDHLLSLAEGDDDPVLRVEAHYVLAMTLQLSGALIPARVQLEASLARYDRARSAAHIGLYSQDPGVVCMIRLSFDLWLLGDPGGSAEYRTKSLDLAQELGHPFTLGYALTWDAVLQNHRGNPGLAQTQAEAAMTLGRDHRMPFWLSIATVIHGWAVAERTEVEVGVEEIRRGMADFKQTGSLFMRPFQLGLLAEQHGRLGNAERGLTLISEALALVERTGERWCEAELYRRKGDLLVNAAGVGDAETAYQHAVDVARYQGARTLELRAAIRLAEIWHRQDRAADASLLLAPIVQAIGPVLDLPELDRARTLLGLPRPNERPRID